MVNNEEPQADVTPDDLIRVGEASRMLGVSILWLRRMTSKGEIPSRRINGARYYIRADVLAFKAENM